MNPDQIIALIATLLAGEPDTSAFQHIIEGGSDPRYPVTVQDCPRLIPMMDIEQQTLICGTVNVPENHDDPDGNRLDLAFALLKSRSLSSAADPVIYLHGGPGSAGTVFALDGTAGAFDFLRDRRDFIMFDQRSAGLSARTVTCYNAWAERIFDLAAAPAIVRDPEVVKDCLDEIVDAGNVNIADYNTTQNAHDVRAIMSSLGYPTYNVYGASYGTKLGQELMRVAPDGLRSVVLDSIVPMDSPSYDTNGRPLDEAIGAVVSQCAEHPGCNAAFPDLEGLINSVAAQLKAEPIAGQAGQAPVDLMAMISLFEDRNVGKIPNVTSYIPAILSEFSEGGRSGYDAVTAGLTTQKTTPEQLVIGNPDVPSAQLAMAYSAAYLAEQTRDGNKALEILVQRLTRDRAVPSDVTHLADQLDQVISGAIGTMERDALLEMGTDFARSAGDEPSRANLQAFLTKHLPEPQKENALAILALMSDNDIAAFHETSQAEVSAYTGKAMGNFDFAVYACQESRPFNSLEGFRAELDNLRFQFLRDYTAEDTEPLYAMCEAFTAVEREGFHVPVISDIPTLALAGMNDVQTNPSAAEHMTKTLTNVQAFTFPEAGHGVIFFSQCAKDMMIAFLENPNEPVNGDCISGLRPKFVTP